MFGVDIKRRYATGEGVWIARAGQEWPAYPHLVPTRPRREVQAMNGLPSSGRYATEEGCGSSVQAMNGLHSSGRYPTKREN